MGYWRSLGSLFSGQGESDLFSCKLLYIMRYCILLLYIG
jgi:hypothetical protein